MKKETQKSIVRLVLAALLLVNAFLTARGQNPLPFTDTMVSEFLGEVLALASILWVWWKNNNITPEACTAQVIIDEMKATRNQETETVEEPKDSEVE